MPDVMDPQPSQTMSPIPCSECGWANSSHRKFCAGCGSALARTCPACGAESRMGEKYCGMCGADLAAALRKQQEEFAEKRRRIEILHRSARYGEAMGALGELVEVTDPRLAEYRAWAERLLTEIQREVFRLEQQKDAISQAALASYAGRDYQRTRQLIEQLPGEFLTNDLKELLDQASAAEQEAASLLAEIRRSVAAKRTDGLLQKVERLLILKPHHEQARALAEKLRSREQLQLEKQRDRLFHAARTSLQRHDYETAANWLDAIAPSVRTPEVTRLLDEADLKAREVAWMVEDLRDATAWDEHLLPIAERLLEWKPRDEALRPWVQELRRQDARRRAGEIPTLPPRPDREKAPRRIGYSLDTVGKLRRIVPAAGDRPTIFQNEPASFCVACGLALQGLDQAPVATNLIPARKGALASLVQAVRKRKPRAAWGIDLGQSALKAVKLSWDPEQSGAVVEAAELVEYPGFPGQSECEAADRAKSAIRTFLGRNTVQGDLVCVGFPGENTLTRHFEFKLPPAKVKRLPDLVQHLAGQEIPFPLEEVRWDYSILEGDAIDGQGVRPYQIGFFAIRQMQAGRRLAPFKEAGIQVDILQSDSVALHNLITHEFLSSAGPSLPGTAPGELISTLDIGAEATSLVLSRRDSVWLRSIPVGGNHFTRAIMKEFRLTFTQAEHLKRNPATAPELTKLYAAMQPVFQHLVAEVRRSLGAFSSTNPEQEVARGLAVGRACKLHGFSRYL
ncbi:MAG: pilus assembly protein PilM [Pirellulales bacterium]